MVDWTSKSFFAASEAFSSSDWNDFSLIPLEKDVFVQSSLEGVACKPYSCISIEISAVSFTGCTMCLMGLDVHAPPLSWLPGYHNCNGRKEWVTLNDNLPFDLRLIKVFQLRYCKHYAPQRTGDITPIPSHSFMAVWSIRWIYSTAV